MVQFARLRLYGFKSFAEKTELDIGPGLNGIVGPNGCGKSNLVEALRWVMGESSAKRMRGGGMNDVIFAGTERRAARNIAEVSILLENPALNAPAPYTKEPEIDILRRITRDQGSNYKINAKNVRARDVQILFADTMAGANSPALVSQGQVAQIINAKPADRRMILEDSAGVSGLNTRRHEAQLRLKATEKNLERIEDIFGSLETRLNSLKRQSRQAEKYRQFSAQIRQLELLIAYLEWTGLKTRLSENKENFNEAESRVAAKILAVSQLTRTHNTQMEDLPALRRGEAEASARLQHKMLALQRLEDEAARALQETQETQAQKDQAESDNAHEQQTLTEVTQNLENLKQELENLVGNESDESEAIEALGKNRDTLEETVTSLEEQYNIQMQNQAEFTARKNALENQIKQNTSRLETLQSRKQSAQDDLNSLQENSGSSDEFEQAQKTKVELSTQTEKLSTLHETTSLKLEKLESEMAEHKEKLHNAKNALSKLDTEIETLERFVKRSDDSAFKPVLDDIIAKSGYEKALSRALGEGLLASLDAQAPSWWEETAKSTDPLLPAGTTSLLSHTEKAPTALHAILSHVAVAEDGADIAALKSQLKPGQILVTKDGQIMRWDGYRVTAQAQDRNAQYLEQTNKLRELQAQQPAMVKTLESAQNIIEEKQDEIDSLKNALKDIRTKNNDSAITLRSLEARLSALRESQIKRETEVTRLQELVKTAAEDIEALEATIKEDRVRLENYEQEYIASQDNAADIEKMKADLAEKRADLQETIRKYDRLVQTQNSRKARIHAIADERINLQNRSIRSNERLKDLTERIETLSEKLSGLKATPKSSQKEKEELLSVISELERSRNSALEAMLAKEKETKETAQALKESESALSEAKEKRAHFSALMSSLSEQSESMHASIQDKFKLAPEALSSHITRPAPDNENIDSLRAQREEALQSRHAIGPVNLQADKELEELQKEAGSLTEERDDLVAAVEELRTAIEKIDEEAKNKISRAFDLINEHFKTLFTRLFPGGKAHLEMIDSEDLLKSGLEIYAQPPGKALQSLSLLSGGEQALTSIALIFAMFLTNPSPICVLDEIDAPLDDANVDRLCQLLEEMVKTSATRFLVITHHRLTMARMDRLYGVTMSEKGVSQLVSVDLQQSFSFVEAA